MKTYAKLTGRVILALLVSKSPAFGKDAQQANKTKQTENKTEKQAEQAGWSTRKKIGVGVAVALGLGGGAYATYRLKPELISSLADSMRAAGQFVGTKAVIAKNLVVDKTRAFLGYDPKPRTMIDHVDLYKVKALRAFGYLPYPESLKQKAVRYAATAYASSLPVMNMVKEVTISTAKNHPYMIVGSFAVPTSAGGLYIHYKNSSEQDIKGQDAKGVVPASDEVVQANEPAPQPMAVAAVAVKASVAKSAVSQSIKTVVKNTSVSSAICHDGSCGIKRPASKTKAIVKKSTPKVNYVKSRRQGGCSNGMCSVNRKGKLTRSTSPKFRRPVGRPRRWIRRRR